MISVTKRWKRCKLQYRCWLITYSVFISFLLSKEFVCAFGTQNSWKQLIIGGSNLTHVQCTNIGNQFNFLDTIKYYQQSLTSLASNASKIEKTNIKKTVKSLNKYSLAFDSLSDEEKNSMLDYMPDSKGVIRYEKINSFHDLDAVANQDGFFAKIEFYSTLRNQIKSGD